MIDKIIFTRDKETLNLKEQLEFVMPVGYKLIATEIITISHFDLSVIDFKVKVYSEKPVTFIFTEAIHSTDFKIIDKVQMIPPKIPVDLKLTVFNPNEHKSDWVLEPGSLVATMVPVETVSINLFEMSNNKFKQYV